MGNPKPDETQQALRALDGRICPKCRHRIPPPDDPSAIARCPNDGLALVAPTDLADADGDPFLGTSVGGRFVVLGKLGAGSMGTVYRARQEAVGRDVAIKILRSDRAFDTHAKARFQREARAMSLLTSPHTVTVFDFGEIPDESDEVGGGSSLYLAMELLHGESLGERLKRSRRLAVPDAVRIARHALLSLAEAHEKGVIHRDLKPDNLFLCTASGDEEVCKVLDFGIAKLVNDSMARVDALETQAGTVFGTPRYMSPEQAQGKPLDARSDLYSLGVLLYQMVVGRAPFVDDDAVVVMARHIKSIPTPSIEAAPDADIPEALSAVIARVLAKDPDDRPASAKELILDLDTAMGAPRRPSSRPDGAVMTAGASGEMSAVTRDDLDAPAKTASGSPPPRRSIVARVAAVLALLVALLVLVEIAPLRKPSAAGAAGPTEAAPSATAAVPVLAPTAPATEAAASVAVDSSSAPSAQAAASSSTASAPSSTPVAASAKATPGAPAPTGRKQKKYTLFE